MITKIAVFIAALVGFAAAAVTILDSVEAHKRGEQDQRSAINEVAVSSPPSSSSPSAMITSTSKSTTQSYATSKSPESSSRSSAKDTHTSTLSMRKPEYVEIDGDILCRDHGRCWDSPETVPVAGRLFLPHMTGSGDYGTVSTVLDASSFSCKSVRFEFGLRDSEYGDGYWVTLRLIDSSGTHEESVVRGQLGVLSVDGLSGPFRLVTTTKGLDVTYVRGTASCLPIS